LARRRDHRFLKSADTPYEDEKFSYLIAGRARPDRAVRGRVIAPARRDKAAVTLTVCDRDGAAITIRVARRDAGFAAARKLSWGDAVMPVASGGATQAKIGEIGDA